MAKEKTTPRLPAEAKVVQRRIEAWRATRRKGTAMPEELWQAAASLAQKHGLYTIARGLPLEYVGLKRRVNRLVKEGGDEAPGSADFVEIDMAQVTGAPEIAGPVVELARPDGARMVVRLPRCESLDVARLAAAFCGGGS